MCVTLADHSDVSHTDSLKEQKTRHNIWTHLTICYYYNCHIARFGPWPPLFSSFNLLCFFFSAAFHYRICSYSTVYLQTATSIISLGFPTDLLTPKYSPITSFCGYENHPKVMCVQTTAVYVTIWQGNIKTHITRTERRNVKADTYERGDGSWNFITGEEFPAVCAT